MSKHGFIGSTARITVRRVKHEGETGSVTARVHPEGGHASSGLTVPVERNGRSKRSGRTIGRWIRQLRNGNADGTVVIEDGTN